VRATKTFDQVSVGDELPELSIAITRTLVVSGALASRDYQDVHHDAELARARGSKDIFMNILTTNGLVGRYVTDWSGPGGLLREVAIRLGAPNYPDDTMVFTGTVTSVGEPDETEGRAVVEVNIVGTNSIGNHVSGTVAVALPLLAPGGTAG
jgi:acyl dehydratase